MKRSEILESNDQYVSMWKVLAGDRKGADLRDKAGLSVCWADSPFPFWNALFINENISDRDLLRVRLRMSRTYMLAKQHSGLVYVCEDLLSGAAREELDAIAASENLTFALDITGMAGDILPLEAGLPHPVLDFARVDSETALQAYADINSEGYGFPLEAGRAGLAGSTFWKKTAFAYIGYLNGQPVSTAAAIVNEGAIYLALVATRPDAQRNGFGEAIVRHALNAAYHATAIRRTILHATDAGLPVYMRVGYHRTTVFKTYRPA
ncbi:GNAT family N-acetyltransferase [Paraburkholderia caledonica]|jgi:GNAT superfamily N-acetyltransferase|uniref:GNAT family N-acetyltransferase n=1 Tax=Paraburkholderia caledonica TaxID=134536 RepID=UPI0038B8CB9B